MARAKALTVRQEDVRRLEGVAQSLADMEPMQRPRAEAVDHIAQQLGVRRRTVQEWIRLIRPMSRRNDTAEAFFSVYEKIANLLSENLETNLWSMVKPGERDAFRAATWLLPRVNPERFDPATQSVAEADDDDVFDTAGVSQDVFDSMTDDEREMLASYRQTVLDAVDAYELLVRSVQARLMAEELEQRSEAQRL